MVSKTTLVNRTSKRNDSFGKRIVLERERLGLKQVDLCVRAGVSKTTQIKYEAGERIPDIEYLACLEGARFDVMYILTGERSGAVPLSPELQNLLDAYQSSPLELRRAVFGVLLSQYEFGWDKSRVVPGYFRHEVLGEDDARFEAHNAKQNADHSE